MLAFELPLKIYFISWSRLFFSKNQARLSGKTFSRPQNPYHTLLFFIGVCIDTYVFYQSVLEKKTYQSQIWSVCIAKRHNVIMSWRHVIVTSDTSGLYDYPFNSPFGAHTSKVWPLASSCQTAAPVLVKISVKVMWGQPCIVILTLYKLGVFSTHHLTVTTLIYKLQHCYNVIYCYAWQ